MAFGLRGESLLAAFGPHWDHLSTTFGHLLQLVITSWLLIDDFWWPHCNSIVTILLFGNHTENTFRPFGDHCSDYWRSNEKSMKCTKVYLQRQSPSARCRGCSWVGRSQTPGRRWLYEASSTARWIIKGMAITILNHQEVEAGHVETPLQPDGGDDQDDAKLKLGM